MKTTTGSRHYLIVPELILALLAGPFAYAAPQAKGSQLQFASSSSTSPQTEDDDNAPVPPMPPVDPAQSAAASTEPLPDSPGAIQFAQLESQLPAQQQAQSRSEPQPPPQQAKEPLGTAAAQTVPTMGVAASKPAGAALAPAKQRRIRTILIRTGAIVGAAAALGVTMALTEASPSKPPGAH